MLTLDALFDADAQASKPRVTGKWFEIQLSPDPISGERLNIGVGFIRARTRQFHFRLLDTAAPFACLYGQKAREQFDFLLQVTRDALTRQGIAAQISPQIRFGEPRHAQGERVEDVLEELYDSQVTLARMAHTAMETLTSTERHARKSTETIRKRIRQVLRKHDPMGFQNYWRDEPVQVPVEGNRHRIDLQIWQEQGLFNPRCFASIVSACYNDSRYRAACLHGAYRDLTIARGYIKEGKAKGGIFILRPVDGDDLDQIDNEIDETTWALEQKFGITPYVVETLERLKQDTLSFALID